MSYIFAVKIVALKKTEKNEAKQDLCRQPLMAKPPLPTAADGKGNFANSRGRQSSHVAATCASWELTHLASLPTAADGKGFAYSG
jgi:hypothetical protein